MLKAFLRIAVFSSHPPSFANAWMYVAPIVSLFAVRSRIRAQSRHVRIALHISPFQLILFRSRWTANILAQNGTSIWSVLCVRAVSVLLCRNISCWRFQCWCFGMVFVRWSMPGSLQTTKNCALRAYPMDEKCKMNEKWNRKEQRRNRVNEWRRKKHCALDPDGISFQQRE